MTRTVIIVSPHFPPSTLAAVHRTRHLAKHLPAHGWRPVVVRVAAEHYGETNDPGLAALLPASLEQVQVGALPLSLTRPLGLSDIGLRAYRPIGAAIDRLAAQEKIDAVMITGFPCYPMLLARHIKKRWNLPVLLDFQDPWVSAHGGAEPRWSKAGLAHSLAVSLEPRALRHADFVTSVSDIQNAEMAARYPWLDRARMAAIPIGGDPEDFATVRGGRPTTDKDGVIQLSYVGTFLPRAGPLVATLFDAVANLRRKRPDLTARLRLDFVGTSNSPDRSGDYRIRPLAEAAGIADLVHETPQRVPFLDALGILARSHGLLLIGSDEPHYTASKVYPAMMSGRPYLSLFHRASSAHAILQAAGGGAQHAFGDHQELAALSEDLTESLARLISAPETLGEVNPQAYADYTAGAVAGRFATIFDRIVAPA